MKRIIKRAIAAHDLDEQAAFIGRHSPNMAIRFLEAADQAFRFLVEMPTLAGVWDASIAEFAEMRVWPIKGFEKHLIFYQSIEDGIEVIRVLHGARDLRGVFGK